MMESTSLLPIIPGRPPLIKVGSTTIFLSIHDAEVLRRRKEFKLAIKLAHPDRGGKGAAFMKLLNEYRRFLQLESKWYAELGLKPPYKVPEMIKEDPDEPKDIEVLCEVCKVRPIRSTRVGARCCSSACAAKWTASQRLNMTPEQYMLALRRRKGREADRAGR